MLGRQRRAIDGWEGKECGDLMRILRLACLMEFGKNNA